MSNGLHHEAAAAVEATASACGGGSDGKCMRRRKRRQVHAAATAAADECMAREKERWFPQYDRAGADCHDRRPTTLHGIPRQSAHSSRCYRTRPPARHRESNESETYKTNYRAVEATARPSCCQKRGNHTSKTWRGCGNGGLKHSRSQPRNGSSV